MERYNLASSLSVFPKHSMLLPQHTFSITGQINLSLCLINTGSFSARYSPHCFVCSFRSLALWGPVKMLHCRENHYLLCLPTAFCLQFHYSMPFTFLLPLFIFISKSIRLFAFQRQGLCICLWCCLSFWEPTQYSILPDHKGGLIIHPPIQTQIFLHVYITFHNSVFNYFTHTSI